MASSLSDILSTIQNGVIALNNMAAQIKGSLNNILSRFVADEASIAAMQAAWTVYTPTITSSVGVITTVAATGRYLQTGKTVFVNVTVTITVIGTGAGQLIIPLPVTAKASNNQALASTESVAVGVAPKCEILASAPAQATVVRYDAATYIVAGAVISISGVYEAA